MRTRTARFRRLSHDPPHGYVSEIWLTETAPYGPAWEALATAPASAAGTSAHRAELGYRGSHSSACSPPSWSSRAERATRRRWRCSAGARSIALHYAGGGHSDAWMTALLVFAVATPQPRPAALRGACRRVQAVPAVLLPLELAARRFRWRGAGGSG